jgi:hypothetical protein
MKIIGNTKSEYELAFEILFRKFYVRLCGFTLENLLAYYRMSDGASKKKILNTIFAEKLIVINGKVIEPIFTEPIQLILRISNSIANSKGEKEVDLDLLFLL